MFGELSLVGAILTVVFVLFLAYWSSRVLGKNWIRTTSGRNIKVIEQVQIGPDKQLLLVRLLDRTYFLGTSQAGIQLLSEIEGDVEAFQEESGGEDAAGFRILMKKYASLHEKRKEGDK